MCRIAFLLVAALGALALTPFAQAAEGVQPPATAEGAFFGVAVITDHKGIAERRLIGLSKESPDAPEVQTLLDEATKAYEAANIDWRQRKDAWIPAEHRFKPFNEPAPQKPSVRLDGGICKTRAEADAAMEKLRIADILKNDPHRAKRRQLVREHFLKHFQIGVEAPAEWLVEVRTKQNAPFVTSMQYLSGSAKPGDKGDDQWFYKYGGLESQLASAAKTKTGSWFTWYTLAASAPALYKPGPAQATPVNAKNVETMRSYWEIYKRVMRSCGKYPESLIVMQIEPDEWGHLLLSARMEPEKVDVKVGSTGLDEIKDLPDNLIGWAKAFKRLRDLYAPHVLLCCNPSFWDNKGSMTAKKWAGYFKKCGVDEWELAVGQFHDWDHGVKSNGANAKYPPYANKDLITYFSEWDGLFAWIKEWNREMGLPLVMWQVPVGNSYFRTCDGSPGHGCDGLAEALLEDYPKNDLVARFVNAGCVGWIFSRGGDGARVWDGQKDGITNPEPASWSKGHKAEYADDDGGYMRLRGEAYFKQPCAVKGSFAVGGMRIEAGDDSVASASPGTGNGSGKATAQTALPVPVRAKLKKPSADVLKEWEQRLQARVRAVLPEGRKPRFEFSALKERMIIQSLNEKGAMKAALEKGGTFDLAWAQLTSRDHLNLALGLTEQNAAPEDYALAAFFLFNADETERAQAQLAKADACGKEIMAIFRE
jgi:hypothetical protein